MRKAKNSTAFHNITKTGEVCLLVEPANVKMCLLYKLILWAYVHSYCWVSCYLTVTRCFSSYCCINPLKAKLNLICHQLALLGAYHILHVSRIRVNVWIFNTPPGISFRPDTIDRGCLQLVILIRVNCNFHRIYVTVVIDILSLDAVQTSTLT
jgi:hypothetical protein